MMVQFTTTLWPSGKNTGWGKCRTHWPERGGTTKTHPRELLILRQKIYSVRFLQPLTPEPPPGGSGFGGSWFWGFFLVSLYRVFLGGYLSKDLALDYYKYGVYGVFKIKKGVCFRIIPSGHGTKPTL